MAPGRYPPKYRMPIHSNVIEPVEDYSDEEVMPDVMEEEPIVMESMGPSYSGGSMPIITSGSMGQSMSMMGPSSSKLCCVLWKPNEGLVEFADV